MSYLPLFSRDFSLAFVMLRISCLVCCYENWFDLLWEKNVLVIEKNVCKFEAKGWEFAKFEITRTIYLDSEMSEQFLKQNTF